MHILQALMTQGNAKTDGTVGAWLHPTNQARSGNAMETGP